MIPNDESDLASDSARRYLASGYLQILLDRDHGVDVGVE